MAPSDDLAHRLAEYRSAVVAYEKATRTLSALARTPTEDEWEAEEVARVRLLSARRRLRAGDVEEVEFGRPPRRRRSKDAH